MEDFLFALRTDFHDEQPFALIQKGLKEEVYERIVKAAEDYYEDQIELVGFDFPLKDDNEIILKFARPSDDEEDPNALIICRLRALPLY